jgi:hypothetical protein
VKSSLELEMQEIPRLYGQFANRTSHEGSGEWHPDQRHP